MIVRKDVREEAIEDALVVGAAEGQNWGRLRGLEMGRGRGLGWEEGRAGQKGRALPGGG